jgi:hypothetical protein
MGEGTCNSPKNLGLPPSSLTYRFSATRGQWKCIVCMHIDPRRPRPSLPRTRRRTNCLGHMQRGRVRAVGVQGDVLIAIPLASSLSPPPHH